MAYIKWIKKFWCGNTAIGLFCSPEPQRSKTKTKELYWGTTKNLRADQWNGQIQQALYLKTNLSLCSQMVCGSALIIITIFKKCHILSPNVYRYYLLDYLFTENEKYSCYVQRLGPKCRTFCSTKDICLHSV